MPKVSVIIPVYNVEKYLMECLDSVINQTLKDIEIICINDGSTDNSPSILNEYANNDNRIILLNGLKLGAGAARNLGLKHAKGEYLSFLDSDDFFELNMLEEMYNNAKINDSDIVVCNRDKFNINTGIYSVTKTPSIPENLFNKKTFCYKDMPNEIFHRLQNVAWNKLFKTKFILENDIHFQEIKRTNDLFFVHSALAIAQRISWIDKIYVHYRYGQKSNLQKTNYLTPYDFTKALIELKKFLIKKNLFYELKNSYSRLAIICINRNANSLCTHPRTTAKLYLYLIFYVMPKIGIPFWKIEYKYLWKAVINIIFSVKNDEDGIHKIITILGVKIKFNRREKNAKS